MFSGGLKFTDDDDDLSFDAENGRSKLSSIFGITESVNKPESIPSLQYTPPKQTKSLEKVSHDESANEWKVQVAKVVTAYKLLNQENLSQGKVGIALLKNSESQLRIILYRSKTNVISNTNLHEKSTIFRNGLYLQFFDDLQIFWSVLFEAEDIEHILTAVEGKVCVQINQKPDISSHSDNTQVNDEEHPENASSDDPIKETKANILSRMAKMGQPLPKLTPTVTTSDISDSSDMEMKKKAIQKPMIATRKPKAQALIPLNSSTQQVMAPTSNNVLYHPMYAQDPQCLNVLFAENRTQNTEVRMNLCKLETKIDRVLDKIEGFNGHNSKNQKEENKDDEILELEEKMLELKKQNRNLKMQIRELEQNTLTKDDRILPEDYKEFAYIIEKFNINPKAYTTSSDLFKEIIRHLDDFTMALNNSIQRLESASKESNEKLNKIETDYNSLQGVLDEQKQEYEKLKIALQKENEGLKLEKSKILNELNEVQSTPSQPSAESLVLEIMNNLYQRLSERLEGKDTWTAAEANQIVASAIKHETKSVIRRSDKTKTSSDK